MKNILDAEFINNQRDRANRPAAISGSAFNHALSRQLKPKVFAMQWPGFNAIPPARLAGAITFINAITRPADARFDNEKV
ncbi:hypothetical protein [Erwinia mallotivora]|uniref:hypothetical protein n=1 Tax=Erwinia mallotivora TaxID=69222 RepID=UPI0021BE14C7|nr:hypothetical protein [Erwinia mallotivora]